MTNSSTTTVWKTPRTKRIWASAVAIAAILAGSLFAAAPANAAPTGCSAGGGGTYSTAKCTGGTGYYQAYAVCMNPTIPRATFYKLVEGPWKKAKSNETSTVWCPFLYVVSSRGVGLKN